MRIILFLISFLAFKVQAQVVVVDSLDNSPISDVQLYSKNKVLSSKSNQNGLVYFGTINSQEVGDTIFLSHLTYGINYVLSDSLINLDTIKLSTTRYILPEMSVNEIKKKYKYKKVSACYRSYQKINDSLILYSDGTIDYAAKIKKDKYYLKRKEYRVYRNTEYFDNLKERSVTAAAEGIVTPRLPLNVLPRDYFKSKKISTVLSEDGSKILMKDGVKIGDIKRNATTITYTFDVVTIPKARHLLKTEFTMLKDESTLVFRLADPNQEGDLISNLDDLIYYKAKRLGKIKHDKDKEYKMSYNVRELFIENFGGSDDIDLDEYTFKSGVGSVSNYKNPFWEHCDCEAYYLPTEIPYTQLDEMPNKF